MGPCRLDSPIGSVALSGQAPQPRSGAPKARGLRANARTERPFLQGDARLCRTMSVESSTSLYTLEPTSLDVDQELAPALRALPYSGLESDEFLLALGCGA